jgi:hypothetical protein
MLVHRRPWYVPNTSFCFGIGLGSKFWSFAQSPFINPWQTPLNKAPSKGGDKRTKREDPSPSQKNGTQSESQRATQTIMFQNPNNSKKHIQKRKGMGNFDQLVSRM